jgi:transcriptional regulator with XRE-family HTH domain
MKQKDFSQERLAFESDLTQGVISRAANPDYGNLTLNTIIRIAAGLDVAFVGKFVPFSELGKWFTTLSEEAVSVKSFEEEDKEISEALGLGSAKEALERPEEETRSDANTSPAKLGSIFNIEDAKKEAQRSRERQTAAAD